jgi:hypothetical protein
LTIPQFWGIIFFNSYEAVCETIVYLTSDGQEKEIMGDVMLLQPEEDVLLLAKSAERAEAGAWKN